MSELRTAENGQDAETVDGPSPWRRGNSDDALGAPEEPGESEAPGDPEGVDEPEEPKDQGALKDQGELAGLDDPEGPEEPDDSDHLEGPDNPEGPDGLESPAQAEGEGAPGVSEVSDGPDAPDAPEDPDDPDEPVDADEPVDPDGFHGGGESEGAGGSEGPSEGLDEDEVPEEPAAESASVSGGSDAVSSAAGESAPPREVEDPAEGAPLVREVREDRWGPDRRSEPVAPEARDRDDLSTDSGEVPDTAEVRETDTAGGSGPPSDGLVAEADEPPATGQFLDRVKSAFGGGDRVREISDTVDRPDFQLPGRMYGPDAYGTPLDRPDGTRTPLFDGVPGREQTQQGALGDCGIIATLGAVAEHRPQDIMDRVKENEDGTYEVSLNEAKRVGSGRFEPTGAIVKLTVTRDLPVYSEMPYTPAFADSTNTGVAWAPIMEKAVAGIDQTWSEDQEATWQSTHSKMDGLPTGYTRLNVGTKSGDRAELLVQLTGEPAQVWDLPTGFDHSGRNPKTQFREDIGEKLADGCPVIVATRCLKKDESPLPGKLVDGHAYELTGIDDRGRFLLRNPYNASHPKPLTFDQLKDSILPNYVTLEKK
ncbi:C2 family cysteine protease [Streptomyces sp. NPDC060000]|uniref:C2 family cysteine protease n=1 Tax=Streptomyces sp. NPDC060000 TaxID=3347031 RepID=UPI0036C9806C